MGQRTIDTILKVSGESEYKTALKNVASEQRVLKSELEKVTSEFRNNANSMEALSEKGEALSKMYANQQEKVSLLRGALESAQKTQAEEQKAVEYLRAKYEAAKKTLSEYGDEVDKNSQEYQEAEAECNKLRDAVIQHQSKLDASTASVNKYAAQLNRAEVELNNLEDRLETNDRLMDEARMSADGCATSIDRYGDAVKEAGDETEKATSSVDALASAMVASGLQQTVEDLAGKLMDCSEAAQEYEHAINQVSTIADESVMSQEDLKTGILDLSTQLRKSANEVADATYNALSAGVETADVLEFTAQSAQLATAGFTDMSTSVDVLTTILNAYKLEADQTEAIASKLVKTQDLGKVTVDQLGSVIGRIIPSAAAYGVNLDNIATAYANMTAAGINAENTTTNLGAMLDELADSGSDVAAILKQQTGKSFSELMADGNSLGDVLDVLGSSVEYDNTAFSNLWSSSTAAKSAVALFDGSAQAFNATLLEIANSSGTVAKNYETMTSASETASDRLEVASENLRIAVGDQLNPVLDELRNDASGVLEKATEIVQENPALISVISGTVTALGLLASGISALMVVKSVTAAMDALNIALSANPATLIVTGIVALGTALATFAAQTTSAKEEVANLTEASRMLAETVENGNQSYEDTVASTEATVATVKKYVERLRELESQSIRTQDMQLEYSMILEKINSLIPGLNAELDEQTHLVKGGADALLEQAEAWKTAALQEAAYARYQADVEAMADAEYELQKNQALLNMAKAEGAEISERYRAVEDALAENLQAQSDLMEDTTLSAEAYTTQVNKLTAEEENLRGQLTDLEVELSGNQREQDILTESIETSSQAVEENADYVAAATEAYASFAVQTVESSDESSGAVQDLADDVDVATQQIMDAYNSAKESAADSINQQIGLFDDLSGKCDMSTQDMIANLLSQQEAFNNYADNIQIAMERGIDMGLVQALADGSEEHMRMLAELVTASDAEIAELNKTWLGVADAKAYAAAGMAEISEEYLKAIDELGDDLYEESREMGKNIPLGAAKGVEENTSTYTSAVGTMAKSGQNKYQEVNAIQSPSRRYRKLAQYDVDGLVVEYQESKPRMQKAMAELADTGYQGAIYARQAAFSKLATATPSNYSGADSQLYSLLQQLLAAVKAGQLLTIDGNTLIGYTAGGYDAEFGRRKILADRGAT